MQQKEIATLNSNILVDTVSGKGYLITGESPVDLSRTRLAAGSVSGKDESQAGNSADLSRTRLAAENDRMIR